MRIAVIGTGHVGLVSCATLAHLGHDVVGCDNDSAKIESLEKGISPFFEPGLEELVNQEVAAGRLRFTVDSAEAIKDSTVVFLCVGTPPKASGEANLAAVEAAAAAVAQHATGPTLVVEKSTVPAGTSDRVKRTLERGRPDLQLEVASNPEFLREGSAVQDSLEPDRILVGAESEWAFAQMREVYAPLIEKGRRLIETNIATAELSKHASNAFLAMKISYANALARMCELAGADVTDVAEVMGSDPRIGKDFLLAGLGYGGYCFPKDLQAFERLSSQLGYDFPLLREIAKINEQALELAVHKIEEAVWNLEGKKIALWGLAFKPGTDDVRLAPALGLARMLLDRGALVCGFDPEASENAKADVPGLEIDDDPYGSVTDAHCVVVCTEWPSLKELDLNKVREVMAHPVMVDGRNLFDPQTMADAGFTYLPTGRPAVS